MGNAPSNTPNPLARNWLPSGPHSYRNSITRELIDHHLLLAHSHDELALHNHLLIKRAGLAHPNVPKLIYFTALPPDPLCSHATFSLTLYLEHSRPPSRLPQPS